MLVYLATPYSHKRRLVRENRYNTALFLVKQLLELEIFVYSPIVHNHNIASLGFNGYGFDKWKEFDRKMISVCDELWMAKMNGWENSKGMYEELIMARDMKKPVVYLNIHKKRIISAISFRENIGHIE